VASGLTAHKGGQRYMRIGRESVFPLEAFAQRAFQQQGIVTFKTANQGQGPFCRRWSGGGFHAEFFLGLYVRAAAVEASQ